MRRNRMVYWRMAKAKRTTDRENARTREGTRRLAARLVGPKGVAPRFGKGSRHQNGASDGDRYGNVARVDPGQR